jgi:hypothetical protein
MSSPPGKICGKGEKSRGKGEIILEKVKGKKCMVCPL